MTNVSDSHEIRSSEVEGFDLLSKLAYQEAGLVLSESKAPMILSRLRHRMRELSLKNLTDYCQFIRTEDNGYERREMISALTTNVSGFFREPHHFKFLTENVLNQIEEELPKSKRCRIWSAGCSTGQEPYSLAMCILENTQLAESVDIKILATDIDPKVIKYAMRGEYSEAQVSNLDAEMLGKYFSKKYMDSEVRYKLVKEVTDMVTFRELNLIGNWPFTGPLDAIFCRNVVIYFDSPTQENLWPRFYEKLAENGYLFVGHSERVSHQSFKTVGATVYQRKKMELH